MRPLLPPAGHSLPQYTEQLLQLDACRPTPPECQPAALVEIITPLISEVWEHELANHPDQSFAAYVVNGIKQGFRVGYDRANTYASCISNMVSALQHPDVVADYLQQELALNPWWSFLPHWHLKFTAK